MRTFAFSARMPFEKITCPLFEAIRDNHVPDARGLWIAADQKEVNRVKALLPDADNVFVETFGDYIAERWDSYTEADLVKYEEKYDCKPMWRYIMADRFLINRDHEYAVKTTVGLFDFWEYVFTKYEPEIYYDEAIATLYTYVAYLVGRKTGTRFMSQIILRGAEMEQSRHYVIGEPLQHSFYMNPDYKNKTYSKEQWAAAEDYLKRFEEAAEVSKYMSSYRSKPHFQLKFLKCFPIYIKQRFFNPYVKNKASYMYYENWKLSLNPIKFFFRYKRYRKYYNKGDYDRKYVYYPLHFQPEASTIVCAQKYEKQVYLVDSIAKSLPADTMLYVKEHYTGLGNREESFYTDLLKYPNVKIIDPWESPRELIRKAQAVVTLTGTAGWESVLMGKPVIMAGESFFNYAPGVVHVDELYDCYEDAMKNWVKPTREELLQYLCEYLESSRPGCAAQDLPNTYTQDNMKLLADSIMEYANA